MLFERVNKYAAAILFAGLALGAGASSAAADQLDEIRARGTLICGTIGTVPVFNFQDPNTRKIVGYDIDICGEIARELGVTPEVKTISASARIPEVNQGRIDIIAGALAWSPERAEQVDYSYTYIINTSYFAVRADSGINHLKEIYGKRAATIGTATSARVVRDHHPEVRLVTFEELPQAYLALSQAKVESVVNSESMLASVVQRSIGTPNELKLLKDEPVFSEAFGLGVRQGEAALLDAINAGLLRMEEDGRLDTIFDRWFGKNSEFKMERNFKVEKIVDGQKVYKY